jgi:hypothetical protein
MKIKSQWGKVTLNKKFQSFEFRKESFQIVYLTWIDCESNEEFTTIELDEINQAQVYGQYRTKYNSESN